MATVQLDGVTMTAAAYECARETGADVAADVEAIRGEIARSGRDYARQSLLLHCLDGADEDRRQGWENYVDAVMAAVEVASEAQDPDQQCPEHGCASWRCASARRGKVSS